MNSERIPVPVTPEEKATITKRAQESGVSVSEYMRRAAQSYQPTEDEQILDAMIDEMIKATHSAEAAIDDAIAYVEASNKRIAEIETQARRKREALLRLYG